MPNADPNAAPTQVQAAPQFPAAAAPTPNPVPDFALAGILDALLADPHAGVVLADAQCRVQWVSAGFEALAGLTAAQVLGQQPAVFLRGHLRNPALKAYIEDSIQQGKPFWYELPRPTPASVRWLRVSVRPVPVRAGSPVRYMGLLEDITAWKKEQQARANGVFG